MSAPPVLVEADGSLLRITLNRPRRRNAVDLPMARALAAALDRLDADPDLAVGVVGGAGKGFCSGLDMTAYEESGELPILPERGFAGIGARSARKPLIAAIEGFAVAGGLEIALACDIIVAARGAILGLPEVQRGLIATGGGLFGLTRRTSIGAALELALTGEPITAERAAQIGLVDRTAGPGEAVAVAVAIGRRIAVGAPLAVAATKELLRRGWMLGDDEFQALQEDLAGSVIRSADAAEGVLAFNQRRAPRWSGR
jgi:enoyl-CoA hydratase